MSVRRDRYGSLAVCLLIGLGISGWKTVWAADEDRFPRQAIPGELPLSTDRASPYFEEESSTEVPRTTHAHKVAPKRSKVPATGIIEELDTTSAVKTPLPDPTDDEATATPASPGRSGFGPSFAWAAGILAVGWIVRQFLKTSGPLSLGNQTAIELLTRQSIGPQQQLALVRLGRRIILVGTTPTGMSTLATVDDPAEVQALVAELRPAASPMGPTLWDLFRTRKSEARPSEPTPESAPVNVRLSTESRLTTPARRSAPTRPREVNDV